MRRTNKPVINDVEDAWKLRLCQKMRHDFSLVKITGYSKHLMRRTLAVVIPAFTVVVGSNPAEAAADANTPCVLKPANYQPCIDIFNVEDWELYPAAILNTKAWPFLRDNIPLFDCPDKSLDEIYYFRWWIYRKHIKQTPDGFIITEFLPDVRWAGKDDSINCVSLPDAYYTDAWKQIVDTNGFYAPYGATTVERRSPEKTGVSELLVWSE
jgi:hypothetical protein